MNRHLFLLLALLFPALSGYAQFVNFGQDRSSLRWKQIDTENFQLIYPDFFEASAQKMANIYEQLYRHANTLQHKPGKMSMILHADGGIANGNVGWAPRKSELYTMPPQDPTDSWLEHLCTHEFRHIVQIDKVNQGTTKGFYYVFGEIFPIAVVGLYVPMWFMEGDAVCFETAVGKLGRGRSPEFLNEMRAQVVEKGIYSFYKAILGSYKDYVPNRYNMGYFMTANARANYGDDIWAKALERTGRRPFGITPFAKSLKLTMSGRRDSLWNTPHFRSLFSNPDSVRLKNTYSDAKRTLYRDNFTELQQIWKREAGAVKDRFDTVATRNKYYADYFYPTPTAPDGLVAYKKGLQQSGAFVRLKNGKEKRLTRTGVLDDYKFALHGNTIVWAEYKPHFRWEQGGRMTLTAYDLQRKRYKRFRSPHNRFSPFAAGKGWGCVEVNDRNEASIVLLDSTLQHETWRITANREELFIHPAYADGKITTVVQTTSGLHLESIDVATRERRVILGTVPYELDNPAVLTDSTLVFRASFNGNNSLYSLSGGQVQNILNAPFGMRFPALCPAKDSLYFSFYTSDGYKPGKAKLSDLKGTPVEMVRFPLADTLKRQEDWQLKMDTDSVYATRRYRKFTHLVNVHSWGPLAVDLNQREVNLGAVVYSQNKLSTLSFMAGYLWKDGYDHGAWTLNATYSGWWPVVDVEFKSGRSSDRLWLVDAQNLETQRYEPLYVSAKSRLSSAEVTTRLPLNISVKNFNRYIQPYFRYKVEGLHDSKPRTAYNIIQTDTAVYRQLTDKDRYAIDLPNRYYQFLEYGATFSNQTRMTEQEINPRWGQMLSAGFTHSPLKSMELGYQWWTDSRLYFPGFAKNHSLSVYGGFQHMSDKIRNYSNKILEPRGISLRGYEIGSFRGTYRLPLAYPDLNISSVLYIKGVEGAVFFDVGSVRSLLGQKDYYSTGFELSADTHFFRLTYPVHLGFRTGYETQHKKMFANLIFSIGLSI